MVSSCIQRDEKEMSKVTLQGPTYIGTRTWEYRSSNKEVHSGVSVSLGKS
jgi:hypothetical protein